MNLISNKIYNIIMDTFNVKQEEINFIKKLEGALSNNMYLFEINGTKYTFRIPGKNGNLLVDRDTEIQVINKINNMDINVDLHYFDKVTGYKISSYADGQHINKDTLNDELLRLIAGKLKEIHSIDKSDVSVYDKESRIKKYENLAKKEGFVHCDEYNLIMKKYIELNDSIKNCQQVLSHGDLQVSNIVINNNDIYILDWEFSAVNDPYYDIACFGNQDFELAIKLLEVYVDNPSKEDYKRLYVNRLYQCLQWHNVAAYKDKIGLSEELNVPFDKLTDMYLDKAKDFLNKIANL